MAKAHQDVKTYRPSTCYQNMVMLRRLALEFTVIVVVAAIAGTIVTRGYLAPRLARARTVFRVPMFRRVTPRPPPQPSVAPLVPSAPSVAAVSTSLEPGRVSAEPGEQDSVATDPDEAEEDSPEVVTTRRRIQQRPPLPPRLSRTRSGWRIDLRGIQDITTLVNGAQLWLLEQPPGTPAGYVVRARDRAGYLAAMGIRRGDVLVSVNGHPTLDADQALDALLATRDARVVSLRFRRGQSHYVVTAELVR